MLALAVLAEALAVIADHRHHPGSAAPPRAETVEQPTHLAVDRLDLALVATARAVARPIVGRVGIVEMHPQEKRSRGLDGGARRERGVDDRRCRALGIAELAGALRGHAVVVEIEAAAESEAAIEHPRADHRQGRVAAAAQQLGQRRDRRRERPLAVVAQSVLIRIEPGEQRRVRRQGQRHRRQGMSEAQPARRQRVEPWRPRRSAVAARQIGAQSVDGDEQNVGPGPAIPPPLSRGPGRRAHRTGRVRRPTDGAGSGFGAARKKAITRDRPVDLPAPIAAPDSAGLSPLARLAGEEVSVRERPGAGRGRCRAAPESRGSTPGCRRSSPEQRRPSCRVRLRARARASCPPGCRAATSGRGAR